MGCYEFPQTTVVITQHLSGPQNTHKACRPDKALAQHQATVVPDGATLNKTVQGCVSIRRLSAGSVFTAC